MMRLKIAALAAALALLTTASGIAETAALSGQPAVPAVSVREADGDAAKREPIEEESEMKMQLQVGEITFTATLEENAAVDALVEMMKEAPLVVQMEDYSGFEKVGDLGTTLPSSNCQITTQPGDIVLYNGSQIVIFYGVNSWSYTRLGKIDDLTGWTEALGSGDVTVILSLA